MFGIGISELLVILVIALIVLGPKRLPEVAQALGKALGELRKATSGVTDELRNAQIMLEQEARATSKPKPPELNTAPPPAAAPPEADAAAAGSTESTPTGAQAQAAESPATEPHGPPRTT